MVFAVKIYTFGVCSFKLMSCWLPFAQPRVVERHFLDLRKKYGSVLAVDLVNKVHITFL